MENVEVTILKAVIYRHDTLQPGPPGKPTHVSVPKPLADEWCRRGVAKLRRPEDEITREEALGRVGDLAQQLAEAENRVTVAEREKANAEKARNLEQGKARKARDEAKEAGKKLAAAEKRAGELEARVKELEKELAEARKAGQAKG